MVMAKKFKALRDGMLPKRRVRVAARTRRLLATMPMYELRRAMQLSQAQIAEELQIKQGSVSKLERRTDLYISTLRRYVEAMGGSLELRANFPDGSVSISSLGEISDSTDELK